MTKKDLFNMSVADRLMITLDVLTKEHKILKDERIPWADDMCNTIDWIELRHKVERNK